MKKLSIAAAITLIFMLTACGVEINDGVRFGARAAYAVSRHIGDSPDVVINYIEYSVEDGFHNALVEATLPIPGQSGEDQTYERNVYQLSTGGNYYETLYNKGQAAFDEPTSLYIVNCGNATINKQEEYSVNVKAVLSVFNDYIKTGDLALIGMEEAE